VGAREHRTARHLQDEVQSALGIDLPESRQSCRIATPAAAAPLVLPPAPARAGLVTPDIRHGPIFYVEELVHFIGLRLFAVWQKLQGLRHPGGRNRSGKS
jgi:hypothetical protein